MTNREIDALVCQHVMKWECRGRHPIHGSQIWATGSSDTMAPNFSTDISAAMTVPEKCGRFDMIPVDDGWMVGDGRGGYSTDQGFVETKLEPFAIAKTLPRAICDAALKTVGVEVPE